MSIVQLALLATVLTVGFGYLGAKRWSPRLLRNLVGGLGVISGLAWHSALGLGESGLLIKLGFIIGGYMFSVGVLRAMGVAAQ